MSGKTVSLLDKNPFVTAMLGVIKNVRIKVIFTK